MRKSKHTKRVLIASVTSMMISLSMLIGSTFAWFTDSVTSGKNSITAGNLDLVLNYSKDFQNWSEVEAADNLFNQYAIWEPGHAEVIYLKVENKGNLAFKYQFSLNIENETSAVNVNGEEFLLSNYLRFGVVEGKDSQFASRDEAIEAVKNPEKIQTYSYEGKLTLEQPIQYLAIVVFLPKEVGNEANYSGEAIPIIELTINMFATQASEESDDFDNKYDEAAPWPVKVDNSEELVEALTNGGLIELTQDINIDDLPENSLVINQDTVLMLENYSLELSGLNSNQDKIHIKDGSTLTIDAGGNGRIIYEGADTGPHLLSVGKNSKLVINGGEFIAKKTNNRNDAQTIYLNEGSSLEINDGSITAINGTALNFGGDNCDVVINGGKLYSQKGNNVCMISRGSSLVMNGGEVVIENNSSGSAAAFQTGMNAGTLTINDGFISAPVAFYLGRKSKAIVNGGTIESQRLIYGSGSGNLLTINGGNFIGKGTDDNNNPAIVFYAGNVELRGGTFNPNYLYAEINSRVTIFDTVYNGSNPPEYKSDATSEITKG